MASHAAMNLLRLQSAIRFQGLVRLHQTREDDESYLCEVEHPKGSGTMVYVCVSTGLLFDKQSGRCLQSSNMDLLLDSVQETRCTTAQFNKWVKARSNAGTKQISLKRGPKPKGQRPVSSLDFDNDDD